MEAPFKVSYSFPGHPEIDANEAKFYTEKAAQESFAALSVSLVPDGAIVSAYGFEPVK